MLQLSELEKVTTRSIYSTMRFFESFVFAATAIAGALAAPAPEAGSVSLLSNFASTPSATGVHGGFYYLWSTDGQGSANYTNLPGGQYSVQWSGSQGYHYGGKGWNPGAYDRYAVPTQDIYRYLTLGFQ